MKSLAMICLIILGTALIGCADPTAGKPKAVTEDVVTETFEDSIKPKASAPSPAPAQSALSFVLNGENTQVAFVGSKVTGSHDGNFSGVSGSLQVDPSDVAATKLHVAIDMNTVTSDSEKLTGHLKSPDFFEVTKFPKAMFVATSVSRTAEAGDTYTVVGNLTLKGTTQRITFPAEVKLAGTSITMKTEFAINRKNFGIVYPGMADDLIRDDVLLKLNVAATAK